MSEAMERFNVRVYGLLIQDNHLLLSDEVVKGKQITKFPGGGLELGEGTIDCLVREFKEELGIQVQVKEHFYTTDYYQVSYFKGAPQLLSIYYIVESHEITSINTIGEHFTYPEAQEGEEILFFRWKHLNDLKVDDVHLPVDQLVVKLLLENN